MNKIDNIFRMYGMLESDTNDLGSTIHFDKRNLSTFGMRVYNLFFLSCNLFEVVAKEIAGKSTNMKNWKINNEICALSDTEMTLVPMNYKFKPLEALGEVDVNKRKLTWWQGYNSVKQETYHKLIKPHYGI